MSENGPTQNYQTEADKAAAAAVPVPAVAAAAAAVPVAAQQAPLSQTPTPYAPQPAYVPPQQAPTQPGYAPTTAQVPQYNQPPQPTYAPQQPYAPQTPYAPQQPYAPQAPHAPQAPYAPQPTYAQLGAPVVAPVLPSQSFPANTYKQKIRRTIMLIVLAMVLFYVINFSTQIIVAFGGMILSGELGAVMGSLSTGPMTPDEATTRLMESMPMGIAAIASIILGALAFFLVRGKLLITQDLTRVSQRIKGKELLIMACAVMGIQAAFALGQYFVAGVIDSYVDRPGTESVDLFSFLMNPAGLVYIVLLGPIFEEIIFRGAVMRALEPYGQNFAIVLSSLLFGVYHLIFMQSIFAFSIGLILAYCAMHYSLKWAILLHMMNNALGVLFVYFGAGEALQLGVLFVQLALGLIVLYIAISRFGKQLKAGKPSSVAQVTQLVGTPWESVAAAVRPRPFAHSFSSPWLIAGLAIAAVIMSFTMTMV